MSGVPLAIAPAAAAAAANRAGPGYARIGRAATLPAGAKVIGAVAGNQQISVDVVLQPRSAAALAVAAAEVSSPKSAFHRHYVSPAEFAELFAPTASDLGLVESQLTHEGMHVSAPADHGMVLTITASAARMAAAFRTSFAAVRLPGGATGRLSTEAPALPAAIAKDVAGIVGLDDLGKPLPLGLGGGVARPSKAAPTGSTAGVAGGPGTCTAANDAALLYAGLTPDQIARAYGFDGLYRAGDLGAGQVIDVFELEPFAPSDIASFDQCIFGRSHTSQITVVPIDNPDTVGTGSGEAALDVEEISALAPAAHVDVYEAPQTFPAWLDEIAAIVGQDRAPVVSTSWGLCELELTDTAPGFQQVENLFFEQAALEGQSWFAASGDSGSEGCYRNNPYATGLTVSDPASQPYVTGVGGTEMLVPSDPPDEVVWNDGGVAGSQPNGAGGGGISSLWPMASWQSGPRVPGVQNSYSSGASCSAATGVDCREIPDVSANADELHGDVVYIGGFFGTIGGTSAAAPKWAAAAAVTNGECASTHTAPLGFANPALYQIAANPVTYAEAFNDVTQGNNDDLGNNGGAYPATTGYDMATGLGTPRLTSPSGGPGLAALLCANGTALSPRPVVAGVSPDFGPYQGGTTVTLTGSDLTGVTAVNFGTTVVAVSPSQINGGGTQISNIVTPPSPLDPNLGGAPLGGVLVTVGGGAGTSEPSPSATFHFVSESSPGTAVPSVSFVSPSAGPAAGGTTITILGSGFEEGPFVSGSAPQVTLGGVVVPAANVTVLSDNELSVVAPAETGSTACATAPAVPTSSICQVEVRVSNANGASVVAPIFPAPTGISGTVEPGIELTQAVTEFDYAPAPTVTSVSPSSLPQFPNTFLAPPPLVTFTGSGYNLLTLQTVTFGAGTSQASSFFGLYSIAPGELQVQYLGLTGFALVNTIAITVTTAGGTTSAISVPAQQVPNLSTIDASQGPTTGGTTVNATGSGFDEVQDMEFFAAQAPSFISGTQEITVHSPTSLTFVTPPSQASIGDFAACNLAGCSGFVPFTYFEPIPPVIRSFSPRTGPASGGNNVVILGTGLDDIVSVNFGHTSAFWSQLPGVLGETDTEIVAVAPPNKPGTTVPISVVTGYGSSGPVGAYSYVKSPPAPPQFILAFDAGGSIAVNWLAPGSDGGSPIEGYVVTATPAVGPVLTDHVGPKTLAVVVGPAIPGVRYAIRVAAVTALGQTSDIGPSVVVTLGDNGYIVAGQSGAVAGFGSLGAAPSGLAGHSLPGQIVGIAGTAAGTGYWLAGADGSVYPVGHAADIGSMAGQRLGAPIVGIAATPDHRGYWLVASDGGVFNFGDARFHGSLGGERLAKPIVAILASPGGGGYWLVAADGGVFAFGDARFLGSLGGRHVNSPIVAILPAPIAPYSATYGYWLVAEDGGVFSFGGAKFYGSLGAEHLNAPIVAAAVTPDQHGYWLLGRDGAIYALGSARYEGGAQGLLGGEAAAIAT